MRIKAGASITGLRPELAIALTIIADAARTHHEDIVITSGTEAAPGRIIGSLHHTGSAIDIRRPDREPDVFAAILQLRLGTDFDVLLEGNHIHIEFQPK